MTSKDVISAQEEKTENGIEKTDEVTTVADATPVTTRSDEDAAKRKGNDFEGFVADVLKSNSIAIKQWNQGAITESGAHAEDIYNPDFFVSQKCEGKDIEYWVECKFRSSIPASGFELEERQVERYRRTQGSSKRKVVIALGLGGEAAKPDAFYIIPLDSLVRFKHIPQKYLDGYGLAMPESGFALKMQHWFINEVFPAARAKKNNK